MALNFPSNPTNGQTYGSYVYDATVGIWRSTSAGQGIVSTTTSAPTTAVSGDMWFNPNDGTMYVYYNDGTSSQWIESRAPITADGYYSPNYIINGGFDIWQRGTSFSNPASGTYVADRFVVNHDGTGATRTVSQQPFTAGAAPVPGYEAAYFLRYAQIVAGSGSTYQMIGQKFEDARSLAGQTVTISFWAKADAARTVTIQFHRLYGTGGSATDYNILSAAPSFSLTTSWTRYTATVVIPSVSGKTIGPDSYLWLLINLPLNVIQTIDIWGVQIESGSVATPFRRNANSIQGELAACQRYYYRHDCTNYNGWLGFIDQTNTLIVSANLPVAMRIPPVSITTSGPFEIRRGGVTATTVSSFTFGTQSNQTNVRFTANASTANMTAGQAALLTYSGAGGGAWLDFSAEL